LGVNWGDTVPFIWSLAATSIICILMCVIPALFILLAVLWGVLLVVSACYIEKAQLIAIFLINNLIYYLLAGFSTVFFSIIFFGAAYLAMSIAANYRQGYYEIQKWGIIIGLLSVSFFLISLYTSPEGLSTVQTQLEGYLNNTIKTYDDSGLLEFYANQGISRAEIERSLSQVMEQIIRYLPAFYYLQAIMAVFFTSIVAAYIGRKYGIDRLIKKPFSEEIMPWQLVWVAILGLVFWIGDKNNMSTLYSIGSNLLVVLVPIAMYYGLSVVVYSIKRSSFKTWLIIAMVILTLISPISVVIFLSLAGLFDSLIDYRKVRTVKEDGNQ
jgi:MFS family permease